MIRNLAYTQIRELADTIRAKTGLLHPVETSLDGLMPKTTTLTEDALALAVGTHNTPLLFQSWRTYFMGRLIAQQDRIDHDPEIFFAASILHDIGLTDGHDSQPHQCCFAVSGAERVHDHLHGCCHDDQITDKVSEAISLHLNLHINRRLHGAEAFLLTRGAVCDLFGAGHRRIAPATLAELHDRYPRKDVIEALQFETADHMKDSRPAFMSGLPEAKRPKRPCMTFLNIDSTGDGKGRCKKNKKAPPSLAGLFVFICRLIRRYARPSSV